MQVDASNPIISPEQSPVLDKKLNLIHIRERPELIGKKIFHCYASSLQDTVERIEKLGYRIIKTDHFIAGNIFITVERLKQEEA